MHSSSNGIIFHHSLEELYVCPSVVPFVWIYECISWRINWIGVWQRLLSNDSQQGLQSDIPTGKVLNVCVLFIIIEKLTSASSLYFVLTILVAVSRPYTCCYWNRLVLYRGSSPGHYCAKLGGKLWFTYSTQLNLPVCGCLVLQEVHI